MITLRIPNRSVLPADFRGRQAFCQNLDCRAPLEPPYESARLSVPGGTLETVLCAACMPEPVGGTFPEVRLELVAAAPVLPPPAKLCFLVPVSQLPLPPASPPAANPPRKSERRLTFGALAKLEPRLRDLLAEARAHHRNRAADFCAVAVWFGYLGCGPGLKGKLCRLVGWKAEQGGALRTSEAYDLAYRTVYRALPDCRGRCACSGLIEG
jgi:hypothetical protein